MRAVVQRVTGARVEVGGEVVSSIGRGLCVLIGISRDDTVKDMEFIVRKILNLRVFPDGEKMWSRNVMECDYEVLCVSQFTLQCVLKGNKPDFHCAMAADESKLLYENVVGNMKSVYRPDKIKDGVFGAYMQVHIQNDGPVTIPLESPPSQPSKERKPPNPPGTGRRHHDQSSVSLPDSDSVKVVAASDCKKPTASSEI
ncbi:D-aminoacyl-tRNA deacylase 1-like [Corticium candelabrum]|uniref:D-aminoacyl-tRNA deacylase 1-like n=1 Tax=Corticium candelabrum TaxID=121492 RepID=UPI002E26680C|nr:D-aminoacyl-tRNA deacylase 1-like [Corticium candelabrum]